MTLLNKSEMPGERVIKHRVSFSGAAEVNPVSLPKSPEERLGTVNEFYS
jgi:hypothetical protein